jgi:hypothetical protein
MIAIGQMVATISNHNAFLGGATVNVSGNGRHSRAVGSAVLGRGDINTISW